MSTLSKARAYCDAIWEREVERTNPMLYLRGSAMKLCMIWTKILLCWTCAQKLKLCRGKLTGFRVSIADLFLKRRNRSTMSRPCLSLVGNEYSEKGQKRSKTDKTKHGMEKHEKVKVKHREKQHPPEDIHELIRKLLEDVQNISEEPAEYINSPSWNRPAFYFDDDDDEESSILVRDIISKLPLCVAIILDLPITDSLIMGDEHLSTIPKMESDELIKSSDENLVPIPSESDDFSNIESECDVPDCDDSQTTNFSTFSNPLFDDSTSSDDESSHEEFNLIHNEDLDSTPKNDRFDTESYLIESLLNRDTLMASSPKIDSLFDEFAGELITIPPRIVNREQEEYISLMERLLYDNSSPRPPKDFHANPSTIIESLPTFPIPVEDSDSLREEIDIFPGLDDSIPPGIKSDDYDSEGDDNSTSLPEFESFHVDYPNLGDSTIDVVEDIPVDMPNILPTHPTLHMDFDFIPSHNDLGSDLDVSSPSGDRNKIYNPGICIEVESTRFLATFSPVIDTLLPFSSENKDKVFNYGVLASKEKSPPSSAHWGFKASKLFHHKSPMLIHGENIRVLDVPSARLGCAETKVATWDDLAFKLIILGWNVTNIQKKDKNEVKRTKPSTKWKSMKKSKSKSKSTQKVKDEAEAESEEILNGSTLEGLESERKRLKSSETQLLQEIDGLRQDKAIVVSKVVPHVATKLIRSDEMGLLVDRLVKAAMFHGRSGDDLATALYLFIAESTSDRYASLEELLSKKPKFLHTKPAPSNSKPSSSRALVS
ncbi:hypothetical protein Tco_0597013 [Tanacetum coccineum]